jgi:ankyrin repeat protein
MQSTDVDVRADKASLAHDTSSSGRQQQLAIIRKLVAAGADINARDEHGRTPLLVCAVGQQEAAALLLQGAVVAANRSQYCLPVPFLLPLGCPPRLVISYSLDPLLHSYCSHEFYVCSHVGVLEVVCSVGLLLPPVSC